MLQKWKQLYPNFKIRDVINDFNNSNYQVGGIELNYTSVRELKNDLSPIHSHGGIFIPMIIQYANKMILQLDAEKERRQNLS